jgi:hypothetical protein
MSKKRKTSADPAARELDGKTDEIPRPIRSKMSAATRCFAALDKKVWRPAAGN